MSLAGLGSKITLKNASHPFIDLGNSGGNALNNAQVVINAKKEVKPVTQNKKPVTSSQKPTKQPTTQTSTTVKDIDKEITIVVSDTVVKIQGKEVKSSDNIAEIIASYAKGKYNLVIKDDYAEASTMRKLIKYLQDKEFEYEIKTND